MLTVEYVDLTPLSPQFAPVASYESYKPDPNYRVKLGLAAPVDASFRLFSDGRNKFTCRRRCEICQSDLDQRHQRHLTAAPLFQLPRPDPIITPGVCLAQCTVCQAALSCDNVI